MHNFDYGSPIMLTKLLCIMCLSLCKFILLYLLDPFSLWFWLWAGLLAHSFDF